MSVIDRAGPLTGTNFALSSYEKIQPGFRDEKRPKILGTSFGAKLEKQNKIGETQPSYYFCAYYGFGNPFSCITTVKRVAKGPVIIYRLGGSEYFGGDHMVF